jgi:hypothetical protein
MRPLVVIALVCLTACGGSRKTTSGPPAAAASFPAARWVPAKPTYVIAAKTFRDAQGAFRDVVDLVGMAAGVELSDASAGLTWLLGVDPLSPEAVGNLGIDLEGSMVLFSEDIDPTFVVRLSSPDAMAAFMDKQRERGLVTQSVIASGTELFTAKLGEGVHISWAVDKEWMWIHFSLGKQSGNDWFAHSRAPAGADWAASWDWSQSLAGKAGVVGFVGLRDMFSALASRAPELHACARLAEPVTRVGVAIESDGKHAGAKLTADIGDSSQAIAASLLAPPPGWATAGTRAPIAAQWNLDLPALARWFEPCARAVDASLAFVDEVGARSGRAIVHSLDPDDKSGTGAVALDLVHAKYFGALLDQIPMRKRLEQSRSFGMYKGKHLSVPFVATADYVLDDRVFIAAMGDGLLEKIGSGAPAGQPAVFGVELLPTGLPTDVWEWVFAQAELPNPKRLAQRLQSWNDLRAGARLEGGSVVFEAAGSRR